MSSCQQKTITFSATQLTLFLACKRKYFYQYVLGIKPPQKASAALGENYHKQIERYYKEGKEPEEDRVALALVGLPEPGPDVKVEGRYTEILAPAVKFTGAIDLQDLRDRTHPVVWDHKSTSDFQYAKTDHELARDPQMMAYAWKVISENPGATQVTVRHNYIRTKGAVVAPRRPQATVDRAHVGRERIAALKTMKRMLSLRVIQNATEVEPDGQAKGECNKYGGCYFRDRCFLDMWNPDPNFLPPDTARRQPGQPYATIDNIPRAQQEEILGKRGMEELDKMTPDIRAKLAELAKKKSVAPEPAAQPPPVEAAPPAPEKKQQPTLADIRAEIAKRKQGEQSLAGAEQKAAAEEGVVPPPEELDQAIDNAANDVPSLPDPVPTPPPATRAKVDAPAPEPQATAEAPKRGPGRPRKNPAVDRNIDAPTEPAQNIEAPPAPKEELLATANQPRAQAGRYSESIEILYLDCLPVGRWAPTLEEWIAPILQTIRERTGISWQMHDFRKGTGLICNLIEEAASRGELPSELLVATGNPLGGVCMEVLIPRANQIIQGVKR